MLTEVILPFLKDACRHDLVEFHKMFVVHGKDDKRLWMEAAAFAQRAVGVEIEELYEWVRIQQFHRGSEDGLVRALREKLRKGDQWEDVRVWIRRNLGKSDVKGLESAKEIWLRLVMEEIERMKDADNERDS